jgi:hypothetical protein
VTSTAYADEVSNDNIYTSIIVTDENGNDVQYSLAEGSVTEIPLYAAKESKAGVIQPYTLTQVATLTISLSDTVAVFVFKPSSIGIGLLTLGFTGNFNTYLSGIKYGYNTYVLPVMSGGVSAPSKWTGSLSGTYTVIGYESIPILEAFAW